MKKHVLFAGLFISFFSSIMLADCKAVKGTIKATQVQDCDSPTKICTSGHFKSSILNGTTSFKAAALAATPSEPDMSTSFSYIGDLTISSKKGNVVIKDMGVFDMKTKNFTETARHISGTGKYANVSGEIFIHGQATDTGYTSKVFGKLCY